VRFLIDMPLSPGLAAWLVDRGHDAMHAADLGLARETDAVIMARAKQRDDGITVDLDYPRLLALAEATEPSVILFREGDWSDAAVIAGMADILAAMTESDVSGSILVVDHSRVRRRRLPIRR